MSDKVFDALASTPRRRILAYLSATELTAGDIAERFEMSKPAISKHLSVLENAGLVWREKRGQHVYYGLVTDTLSSTLVKFMGDVCPPSRSLRKESRKLAEGKDPGPETA